MSYDIPNNTKNYLIEFLNTQIKTKTEDTSFDNWINESQWDSLFGNKNITEDKQKDPAKEKLKSDIPGGFGMGGGATGSVKYPKTRDIKDVVMGDSTGDIGLEGPLAAYGIGALADLVGPVIAKWGAKTAASKKKDVIGEIGGKFAGAVGELGGNVASQIALLSGKDWIDANVKNIIPSQVALAAQGAGSPWTNLIVPTRGDMKVKKVK
ncbi:MAG: hypothetical protein ACO3B0_06160 [Chitinophagaceae bacterium]